MRTSARLCYSTFMNKDQLTLGEYMRRVRRGQKWNLNKLATETGLSYTHLSRIENDSTLPRAETVSRIATALGGDLKLMLELANCLPRAIVERIGSQVADANGALKAAAGPEEPASNPDSISPFAIQIAASAGLAQDEAASIARAVELLVGLDEQQRKAIAAFIRSLSVDG